MSQTTTSTYISSYYRQLIAVFLVITLALFFAFQVRAAETDTIAATVTPTSLSVSITDGSIAFGSLDLNTSTSTAGTAETQVVSNDGSDAQLNVKASDATGGTAWTLSTAVGSDAYKLEVSTTTGSSYDTFTAADTYLTALSSFSSLATSSLDFRITTPTDSSDFVEKSLTVTVQVASQ